MISQRLSTSSPLSSIARGITLLFTTLLVGHSAIHAQVVNAYAKVTGIAGNVLTLSNINETNHTFTVGQTLIIMQMQDDVIGANTNDDTNFGNLSAIGNAGRYEVRTITAKTATTITITPALTYTYNTGANAAVQIISYRVYGSPNYTTTADMAALDWDGNVGGVLAIRVNGTLTLNHNITANGAGFRGGAASAADGTEDCQAIYRTATSTLGGEKGESIYRNTSTTYQYGRAKSLNGGGGGNRHNAGGGGGGNVTAGGLGGPGYLCSSTPVGGQGGLSLNAQISVSRIFMGGGGGGAHQNNSVGSAGADGGGIILIKATQIVTTGSCGGRIISANGLNAASGANDGMGGGGAGGSIIFDVGSFSVVGTCTIGAQANGANGGTTNDGATHGGGGGGGQGRIIYSNATPANVTTTTNNGTAGCNNNSSPCNSQAGAASGTNGSGISASAGPSPLPVSLVYFAGAFERTTGHIVLNWATATETHNKLFTLERSLDGMQFDVLNVVDGNGTSGTSHRYEVIDSAVYEAYYYYRLSQTDVDGTVTPLKVIRVDAGAQAVPTVSVYPNPAQEGDVLNIDFIRMPQTQYTLALVNLQGLEVYRQTTQISAAFQPVVLATETVPAGFYTLRIISAQGKTNHKVIVRQN
ncbi:T9SS type A sorting domain-containing protein [Chryseolinea lacunae]|uniref:T9SS type A sorting domain-containing protein n=1 Tax=Chryseolinea lacunae TaxID=2801331 RepID=A0ABS1KYQ2_9BACT|nr:T9SS type A sorting domain-containing protein [Chryseolinea lacunae]MBL0744601.1 T9SS type A sorting domain-containing protein [Chryseolinea lacunae]